MGATQGSISNIVLQPNGEIGGLRLSFELISQAWNFPNFVPFEPRQSDSISETWVYRWTQS